MRLGYVLQQGCEDRLCLQTHLGHTWKST
jgi:hypothetical protein